MFSVLKVLPVLAPLIGAILLLFYWRRAPRAVMFALLAALLAGVGLLVSAGGSLWIALTASRLGDALQKLDLLNTIRGGLSIVAWILLLVAVFSDRRGSEERG